RRTGGAPSRIPGMGAVASRGPPPGIARPWPAPRGRSRGDELPDHPALDEGQALVAPQVRVGQAVLVQAELVQARGVEVAEVAGLLDGPQADRVGGADDLAAPDAAAGQPHREAEVVVVAAAAGL